ncbi:MAG: hypothetical protein GF383_02060, partial [Candidatus Lokiarchaeota archaeon]|nr:hypothetical protein [Candidatus Lokiarchaeota archaeon]
MPDRWESFRGAELLEQEISLLLELERTVGKQFTSVDCITSGISMSFTSHQGYVTGLGLARCGLKEIPYMIKKFQKLKVINLFGDKIERILVFLKELDVLESLNLYDNNISEIPSFIGHLTSLKHLILGVNELIQLPAEIGNLQNLIELS